MWTIGNQIVKREKDFNEELLKIEGELNDIDAKITLARFLKQNVGFTVQLLSGVELLPIQEILIKSILARDNSLVVAGRGAGKSYIISILAFLYPIFNFNSKFCILSANFRGSRRILEETEKIITSRKAKLLIQCFQATSRTKEIIRRAPDMFKMELIQPANAEVFALPMTPGLRGVRSSFLNLDEGLLLSKDLQQNIIRPFLNARLNMQEEIDIRKREDELIKLGAITEKDRISFPKNKYCVFSSASYQFEYLYEMYSEMINNINNSSKSENDSPPTSFVARLSYEAIPQNTILDTTQIETAKASGDENSDYFKREYRALFTDSSESYFNVRKLKECTVDSRDFPTTQIYGDKNSEYVLAIDPSYSSNKNSDFFAMGIYLINKDERKITLVHTYGRAGGELKEHFEYLTYLLLFFNVTLIVIDASGTEFITGYNESSLAKEKGINLKFITANLDAEDMVEYTKAIKQAKIEYNLTARRICWAQAFAGTNAIVRRMNENLQNAINSKKIWFASACKMNEQMFERIKDFVLPYTFKDNNDQIYSLYDFVDDQDNWISETKNQLALIEVKATSSGILQYDLPQGLRRLRSDKRPRKDNYTCLLIAAWAVRYYFDMLYAPAETESEIPMPILIK